MSASPAVALSPRASAGLPACVCGLRPLAASGLVPAFQAVALVPSIGTKFEETNRRLTQWGSVKQQNKEIHTIIV